MRFEFRNLPPEITSYILTCLRDYREPLSVSLDGKYELHICKRSKVDWKSWADRIGEELPDDFLVKCEW